MLRSTRYSVWRMINSRFVHKVIKVPQMADSITEGELARWEKKIGDFVKQDELVATIETDKVDVAVTSPEAGKIIEFLFKEGDSVQIGQDFFKIDLDAKQGPNDAPAATPSVTQAPAKAPVPPAPIKEVKPVPQPVQQTVKTPEPTPIAKSKPVAPVSFPSSSIPGLAPLSFEHRIERSVKMNRMRLKISERLKESQNTAASLTTFNEVDMSNLMEFRNKYKDAILKEQNIKLGFMSAFVKASVAALQFVPSVNASIEEDGEDKAIVFKEYCDISVAVSTPKGLVTPVLRNAEKLSFLQIEQAIAAYSVKARENKIAIEDMAGGTFTISNGGVFGSLYGTPIINLPQSGILGMHAVKDRPVAVNGKIEIRPMMYIALTYDHRLIDGREAVTFLKTVKECIEDPRKLLLM